MDDVNESENEQGVASKKDCFAQIRGDLNKANFILRTITYHLGIGRKTLALYKKR